MLDRIETAELQFEPNLYPGALRKRRWREKKGTAGNPAPTHENIIAPECRQAFVDKICDLMGIRSFP